MEPFPDLDTLLPQRGTMKLVQEILAIEADRAIAGATVLSRWPLAHRTGVDSLVLVELVAQTAAIAIGNRPPANSHGHSNRSGWIVGVSQAHFQVDSIPFGTYITITARTDVSIDNYTKIKGSAAVSDRKIANIDLQVFGMET